MAWRLRTGGLSRVLKGVPSPKPLGILIQCG